MRTRVLIAVPGILLGLFGVFRLLTQIAGYDLFVLVCWLVGALIIHDGILSPIVVAVGAGIARIVPPRARTFLQGGLISAVLIVVVALPMIYREHSQPRIKAILQQNFEANLGILLLIVLVASVLLYVVNVVRHGAARNQSQSQPSETNSRPDAVQDSSTE